MVQNMTDFADCDHSNIKIVFLIQSLPKAILELSFAGRSEIARKPYLGIKVPNDHFRLVHYNVLIIKAAKLFLSG